MFLVLLMLHPIKMTPPEETALQPLREVGTQEKTQFWDIDDVMEALRIANRRGIDLNGLYGRPHVEEILLRAS
jgi:hypothetical protein